MLIQTIADSVITHISVFTTAVYRFNAQRGTFVYLSYVQVYKVKLQRVEMKNSARVSCAHLLKSPSTAEQSLFCKLVDLTNDVKCSYILPVNVADIVSS